MGPQAWRADASKEARDRQRHRCEPTQADHGRPGRTLARAPARPRPISARDGPNAVARPSEPRRPVPARERQPDADRDRRRAATAPAVRAAGTPGPTDPKASTADQ
jgi:hypothetical protein